MITAWVLVFISSWNIANYFPVHALNVPLLCWEREGGPGWLHQWALARGRGEATLPLLTGQTHLLLLRDSEIQLCRIVSGLTVLLILEEVLPRGFDALVLTSPAFAELDASNWCGLVSQDALHGWNGAIWPCFSLELWHLRLHYLCQFRWGTRWIHLGITFLLVWQ